MIASPVGERMTALQPRLEAGEAAALAARFFGLAGRLDPLTSERDQNFRLTAADGRAYVLHAWLQNGGTTVSECRLSTRMAWGARPLSIPPGVTIIHLGDQP